MAFGVNNDSKCLYFNLTNVDDDLQNFEIVEILKMYASRSREATIADFEVFIKNIYY